MQLTLKEILLYINTRVKMNLYRNIQMSEINSKIKQNKKKELILQITIDIYIFNEKYKYQFEEIINKNKDSIEKYLNNLIIDFDNKLFNNILIKV